MKMLDRKEPICFGCWNRIPIVNSRYNPQLRRARHTRAGSLTGDGTLECRLSGKPWHPLRVRLVRWFKSVESIGLKRLSLLAFFGWMIMFAETVILPPNAHADPGCQTVPWGFLGSQKRTICDGPVHSDGSWLRARAVWTPAHQVPSTTSCYGSSYVTCRTYGGYWVDTTVTDYQEYTVTPDTVLPDEPDHLAATGSGTLA